jgi:hypothetical protein
VARPSGKHDVELTSFVGRRRERPDKRTAPKPAISPRDAEGHGNRLLQKHGLGSRASVTAWVAERQARGH